MIIQIGKPFFANKFTVSCKRQNAVQAKSLFELFQKTVFKNKCAVVTSYNPQAQELDRKVAINSADLTTTINRNQLKKTVYTLKIAYAVDGKEYYKEQELNLTGK
ncbi:MAG: hypothetical protein EBT45_08625 [Alphaproteobacteria bacterium]|nr:hypothetical protein [Alphaproteobacteria bacterium]